jgi:hypothetical protein
MDAVRTQQRVGAMGPVEAMDAFCPLDARSKRGDSEGEDGVH